MDIGVDRAGTPSWPGLAGDPPVPDHARRLRHHEPTTTDLFVAKLNTTGSALSYSTFLGGERIEQPGGLAVDGDGNAIVSGLTSDKSFPNTPGALDSTYNSLPHAELRGEARSAAHRLPVRQRRRGRPVQRDQREHEARLPVHPVRQRDRAQAARLHRRRRRDQRQPDAARGALPQRRRAARRPRGAELRRAPSTPATPATGSPSTSPHRPTSAPGSTGWASRAAPPTAWLASPGAPSLARGASTSTPSPTGPQTRSGHRPPTSSSSRSTPAAASSPCSWRRTWSRGTPRCPRCRPRARCPTA